MLPGTLQAHDISLYMSILLVFLSSCANHLYGCEKQTVYIFLILPRTCSLILERKRKRREGGGREKRRQTDVDVREKHWSVASLICLDWELNPQPRYVPWLGFKPANFWSTGQHCSQLGHLARARPCVFFTITVNYSGSLRAGYARCASLIPTVTFMLLCARYSCKNFTYSFSCWISLMM